jgi:hypothetical protein
MRARLMTRSPHDARSEADTGWLEARYAGFNAEERVRAYGFVGQIAFEEASLHVESLDRTGAYASWVKRGDEKQPAMSAMLGDLPPLTVTRYRTVALPSGEVESRWYAFPADEYPDVANRASETNWLHASVDGNGPCPICQSGH